MIDLTQKQTSVHPKLVQPKLVCPKIIGAAECVDMPTPTIEVVSVPSVMATVFATLGAAATTHDDIVSGIDGTDIYFGAAVVSESDLSNYTATIMANGTELAVEKHTDLIDANIIALYPEIADYEGWYLTGIMSNDAVTYQSGAYNVVISIGNVWTATATW